MEKHFINWAKNELGDVTEVEKEKYGDQSDVYRLFTPQGTFFLKISKHLSQEKEKLEWLQNKVPVPKVIAYIVDNDTEALLMTAVSGTNLAHLSKEWSAEKVAKELAAVLRAFHEVSTDSCPFGHSSVGKVLVHGDACLPNFIFKEGIFSGYIDLGDMGIGDKEIDLSAAIWSLQYNLGNGYGGMFLKQYGVENVTEKLVEVLRLKYENNCNDGSQKVVSSVSK